MRRRDVLRATAGAAALPLVSTAATATTQDAYEPLGFQALEKTKEVVVGDAGETAYAATTDGFATIDVSDPANVEILAARRTLLADREGGPLTGIYDVKVDGDTLIVVGPANAQEDPSLNGMLVYDVSDPASPERTAFFETEYPIHNSFLDGDVAYLTANDRQTNPTVVVDLSGDEPTELARWSIVNYDEAWADVHWYVRTNHDVYVHEDVLYIAHWDAGTWLVDVSDPANPEYVDHVGHYDPADLTDVQPSVEGTQLPGNSHYVAVNDDASVLASGAEAWDQDPDDDRNGGPGGIDLWDISDSQNPEKLTVIDAPPTPDPTYGGTWTTSHNFDFHGDRLYTSWYRGGVKIHDISDPANPEELAWWRQPDYTMFWTAQHTGGDAFVASDMNSTGTNHPSGVYTFPDRAGEQADPPSLTSQPSTTEAPTTAAPTDDRPDSTDGTTEVEYRTTDAAGGTTETTQRSTTSDTQVTTDEETDASTPGFGVLAGLGALSAGALSAWRQLGK
jgi:hypothetical protein